MKRKTAYPQIAFAQRHSASSFYPTLNAGSAIWRAEGLLDDAKNLHKLLDAADTKDVEVAYHRHWYGYEVCSYYAVGFITCLEWHARSRLVDLLTFAPGCIQADDFKRIDDKLLSQMTAQNVGVAPLLGGMLLVSSVDSYVAVFNRVFNELSIKPDVRSLLAQAPPFNVAGRGEQEKPNLYSELDDLFSYRHELVHEIGMSVVGPYSLREGMTLESAQAHGANVLAAMQMIEARLTESAPEDFPNKLEREGTPSDEVARIKKMIVALEAEIAQELDTFDPASAHRWRDAVEASKDAVSKQLAFLEEAEFLHPIRAMDFSRPIAIALLRARLDYLRIVRAELGPPVPAPDTVRRG